MTATPTTEPASDERSLARERLKKRRDFSAHLFVYVVINGAIWALWVLTSDGGYPWPAWLSGLWAIGIVLNAWDVYVRRPITEDDVDHEVRRLHDAH
jgi:hypothetical protein